MGPKSNMLEGCRALDLTSNEAQLCGRILSDLGADVIRVERPGGDPCRNTGPFYRDQVHPEKSLWWFVLNANKRGITLDLEKQDGRELFKRLVAGADFVIESFQPGYLGGLGLDYACLNEVNPRIIVTSVTPFGQTGPYRDFKSNESVVMALGVFMNGIGDADRPPVKPNYPLALMASGVHAASATLIAHYYCRKTGLGQHIDVAAQAGMPWSANNVGPWWQSAKRILPRTGNSFVRRPDLVQRFIWPCKDGSVLFQLTGGAAGVRSNSALAAWIKGENAGDDYFKTFDWDAFDAFKSSQETTDRLEANVARFFAGKTQQELVQESEKRGVLLGYITGLGALPSNPQLKARGFWRDIPHPEFNSALSYPGYFINSSPVPCAVRRRAPLIGEHNYEVFGEIGLSREEVRAYNEVGVI